MLDVTAESDFGAVGGSGKMTGTKPLPPNNVFDILTNKNSPQLAPLLRFCTIESATYSPKKRTLTWTGTTRQAFGSGNGTIPSTRQAYNAGAIDAALRKECGEFRFFNRQYRPLGRVTPDLTLGQRLADGRQQVFI